MVDEVRKHSDCYKLNDGVSCAAAAENDLRTDDDVMSSNENTKLLMKSVAAHTGLNLERHS